VKLQEIAMRPDGRESDELRPVEMIPGFTPHAEGSCLISLKGTRVLCNLTIEQGVPRWMQQQAKPGGWITAEYSMLPRSTLQRTPREFTPGGRTMEIRRLIGRSLRAAVNLEALGAYTLTVDCDVLQADGGTRTAAITGGYVALALGLKKYRALGLIPKEALTKAGAAVSVGIVHGAPCLDLCYEEDSIAEVDSNIVMTGKGEFVEIQGTAEAKPFNKQTWNALVDLASKGIQELLSIQQSVLSNILVEGKPE
jgi:ribonuclease PH